MNEEMEDGDDNNAKPRATQGTTSDHNNDEIESHPEFWRFHLESFPWSEMNRLGWTYHSTKITYQAPPRPDGTPGKEFEASSHVLDYLNSFAIAEVHTNLRWSNAFDRDGGEPEKKEEIEIGAKLRADILKEIIKKKKRTLENDDRYDYDHVANLGADTANNRRDNENSNTNDLRRNSRGVDSSRTVTALEKGTDLYLRKRTKSKGAQKKKKNSAADSIKRMITERLTIQECREFIESYPMDEIQKNEGKYHAQFPKWRFLLSTNHSLLFFGVGSKRELLNTFAKEELKKEGRALVIDGTDADVSIEKLLTLLVQVSLNGEEPTELHAVRSNDQIPSAGKFCPWKGHPLVERAIMVGRGLAHSAERSEHPIPLFLIIHSLDAHLATPLAQEAFAALLINSTVANGVACLRLAASVDHVDAPTFLWDPVTESNFSWFPCCVHTYRPYQHELSLIEEDKAQRKKTERESRTHVQAQRILDVLGNLAPRHTEVVQLLAQLQVKESNEWVEYLKYRDRCKAACAINKDVQLRSLLTELKDHGLVVSKTEASKEWLKIPFSAEKLVQIIDWERDG